MIRLKASRKRVHFWFALAERLFPFDLYTNINHLYLLKYLNMLAPNLWDTLGFGKDFALPTLISFLKITNILIIETSVLFWLFSIFILWKISRFLLSNNSWKNNLQNFCYNLFSCFLIFQLFFFFQHFSISSYSS